MTMAIPFALFYLLAYATTVYTSLLLESNVLVISFVMTLFAVVLCALSSVVGQQNERYLSLKQRQALLELQSSETEKRLEEIRYSQQKTRVMTEASLLAQAGQPVETFDSILGFKWCAFTSQNYDDLFIAGIEDGTVTALCAAGQDTSLLGVYVGDTISFDRANFTTASGDQGTLWLYKDSNDGNIVHTLYTRLYCDGDMEPVNTKSALAGESKADFYLVNAFRRYHGLNTLTWSSIAGDAARGHSEDMASSNYFEHTGLDGSTPRTRLQAAGLTSFSCWGENIACGTPFLSGPDVHNNWVNSAGHRDNILTPKYTFFGGGAAYSETSSYNYYYTEDFCSD